MFCTHCGTTTAECKTSSELGQKSQQWEPRGNFNTFLTTKPPALRVKPKEWKSDPPEETGSFQSVHQIVYPRQWILVLDCHLIDCSVVNAHSEASILLLDKIVSFELVR